MNESIFDRRLDEQLCFRLYRASNGINKMYAHALKKFHITFSQYLVLLALWDNDGISVMTIASQTGMGIGTLNPILKRMAENEWIEKSQHPTDKRTMFICLSAKAKESKQPINQAILAEMISCNFEGMDLPELMLQLANLQQRLDTINENK